jgi:transglutaminase-like putative cysteine protease
MPPSIHWTILINEEGCSRMLKYLGIILSLMAFVAQASNASIVPFEPVPDWVKAKPANLNPDTPTDDIRNGVYYLMVDKQTRVSDEDGNQRFRHYSMLAVNPQGVEEVSQINIDYDPNYQSIELHSVTIWRDGKAIDKRNSAKMSLLQREQELDKLIYNGDKTLNILIDDVRINDIVDYSYSINGSNPVFEGSFSIGHALNWSVPLDALYVRIVWLKSKMLNYRVEKSELIVHQKTVANGKEYWLEDDAIDGVTEEDNTPNWFNANGSVNFSDVQNWAEVVQWGTPLFEKATKSGDEIKAIVRRIASETPSKSQQIASILQFVQTQVRYLGIEFGVNSHKPSDALETLARHYGDCKDKVVLLITLLKEIGVEAYPALVNTRLKQALLDKMPRYALFDHVIARVDFEGQSYWLDPTRGNQAGDLADVYQPDYRYALVLDGKGQDLSKVEITQTRSQIIMNETFDLAAEPDMSGKYHIKTQYSRKESEIIRARLASKGRSQLRKEYLEFYQDYYASLKDNKPVVLEDSTASNQVVSEESYQIDAFWTTKEKRKKFTADFYANLISPHLALPEGNERKHPLSIDYPVDLSQNIVVNFEDRDWSFDDETFEEDNDFFNFKYSVTFDSSLEQLTLQYDFVSKTNVVPPEHYKSYVEALKKAKKYGSYGVQKSMPKAAGKTAKAKPFTSDQWLLVGLAVYGLLIILAFATWQDDKIRNKFSGKMVFYPVSLVKLSIFWMATLGLYSIYWFYKNWQYVKQVDERQQMIMPIARGIFSPLWFYPLYQKLVEDNNAREKKHTLPSTKVAVISAILFLASPLVESVFDQAILLTALSLLLVIPMAQYINSINEDSIDALVYNSHWKFGSFIVMLLTVPLTLPTLGYEMKLMPSSEVISGRDILSFDHTFLQRKKVIKPKDEIKLFYSDAVFSIRQDGNGFSGRHVFSYWKEDGKFESESAAFDTINSIDVTWSKSWYDQTVIDIVRKDKSSFLLFVANEGEGDKRFVEQLKAQWDKHKSVDLQVSVIEP